MRTALALLLALPLALAACGGAPSEAHAPMRSAEPGASAGDSGACDLPRGNASVRVAALPSAERDQLQSSLREGPVAVRMEGCRLVSIERCYGRARASYTAAPAETKLTLEGEDDVLRDVPAASERLTPLVRAGRAVEISLLGAGRFDYDAKTLERHFDDSACKDATHLVTGYWVGALAIEERGRGAIERAGDRNGCAGASANPSAPPDGCSALLTLDLAPIAEIVAAGQPTLSPPLPAVTGAPADSGVSRPRGGTLGDSEAMEGHVDEQKDSASGPGSGKSGCDPNDPLCVFARSRSTAP